MITAKSFLNNFFIIAHFCNFMTNIKPVDEENVVYIHNRVLLSLKNEGNSAICNNTGEPWGYHAEDGHGKTDKCCMVSLTWDI